MVWIGWFELFWFCLWISVRVFCIVVNVFVLVFVFPDWPDWFVFDFGGVIDVAV